MKIPEEVVDAEERGNKNDMERSVDSKDERIPASAFLSIYFSFIFLFLTGRKMKNEKTKKEAPKKVFHFLLPPIFTVTENKNSE